MRIWLWAAGGLVLAALGAACGGGSSATPTPTASPTPEPTPLATEAPPETAFRIVYRQFTPAEDVIWRANPLDPAAAEEVARIPHREGFGIKPALSPDGKLLAYLSQPEDALSAQSSQAELFVMDLETKEAALLAGGMDLTFTPMWTPDSRWVYTRSLVGPEFLAADVRIMRVFVPRKEDATPTPTPSPSPTPAPDQTPAPTPRPTPAPVEVVMSASIANVLSFIPVGFADDGKSLFFVQLQGGTGDGSVLGEYSPATTEEILAQRKAEDEAWKAADAENKRLTDEAAGRGETPAATVTPAAPTPVMNLVVELSDQLVFDTHLSPDAHKVSYLVQEFAGDEIRNRTYVADLIAAAAAPLSANGLPEGHHLRPAWHPDGRVTLGVLQPDGKGALAIVAADGGVVFMKAADSGFDEPRAWAPDGTWLAVAHNSGASLVNRGVARLDLVAATGQRVTLIEGVDNTTEDSVLGWVPAPPPPAEAPPS